MVMRKEDEQVAAAAQQPVNGQYDPAFPGLIVAGPLTDYNSIPLEVTVDELWTMYLNARVLDGIAEYCGPRPVLVRFLPDPAAGEVIILNAWNENTYGAQPIKYVETENGAYVNVRLPLQQLHVDRIPDRVRIFPIKTRVGGDGKNYLAFSIKDGSTRPVKKRQTKSKTTGTTTPPTNTTTPPTTAPAGSQDQKTETTQGQQNESK